MLLPQRFTDAEQQLHDEAIAATGLEDFGDQAYRDGLQLLLRCYDNEAQFSESGRYSAYAILVNCLRGRLYAQRGYEALIAARQQAPIEKPVFIVGLPRTGTTVLHKLLAQDPGHQGLEYWLGSYPMPRPPRTDWAKQPRFQEVAQSLEMLHSVNPEMKAIHEMSAEGVDECRLLLMQSFANVTFQSNATVPSYEAWLYETDMRPVYQQYAKSLKVIGSNNSNQRWILKDPSHLWALDTLLEIFPDATIIQTHRDPAKLIPSVSSLVLSARRMSEPDVSASLVGRQQLQQWVRVLERTQAVRERYPDRFVDVLFDDFLVDPLATVKTIYQHIGAEFNDDKADRLRQWLENNPQGKHGKHHYRAEDFGLTEATIRKLFPNYHF